MKALLLLLFPLLAHSQERDSFRNLLKNLIQQDPEFKEVDLQTAVTNAEYLQGLSHLLIPELSFHFGRYEQHNNINVTNAGQEYRYGGINAAFNVFNFGRDFNSFRSARTERKAQVQRLETRLLSRERELGLLVLDFLKEARNLDILKRLVELKERALDVSKTRYQRGSLSEQDYNKVKLDVSNVRAELLVARQSYALLEARIKAYGVDNPPTAYPWEKELDDEKINELLKLSVSVRDLPQFQAAALELEASEYRRKAATGLMFGNVQFNFSRNYYEFNDQDQWEWRTSLVYTLPLFDQFDQYVDQRRSDVIEKTNQVRRAFQERLSSSTQEAETANLEISWKNWVDRKEALSISSRLYSNSLTQFNQGQLSVNELFVDQDRLLRTEQIANLALHQLHGTVLAFCHSRGLAYVKGCF